MTKLATNEWITLDTQFKGITVQRKFAGLDTFINEDDVVISCIIRYWQKELYPNGDVIKTTLKSYSLTDLEYREFTDNGIVKYMDKLAVLSGFIDSLGNPYIVTPTRQTLSNVLLLPFESDNEYPLHRDTREVKDKIVS